MKIPLRSAVRGVFCLLAIAILWQTVAHAAFDSWKLTSSMDTPRQHNAMAALPDGTVLVAGGVVAFDTLYTTSLYNPQTDTWTPDAGMLNWRQDFTMTVLADGSVLAAGGYAREPGALPFFWSTSEIYSGGAWHAAPSMRGSRYNHAAVRLNDGRVLVSGGLTLVVPNFVTLRSAEIYTPGAGWNTVGNMLVARSGHTLSLLPDGRVFAVGGGAGAEIFDPVTNSWSAAPSPAVARAGHTATALPNGRVLVAGSNVNGVNTNSVELFDSATSTWLPVPPMAVARSLHTATLLSIGRVLVAGGGGASAEQYDPTTNTWAAAATMSVSRSGHLAALLNDGRVITVGGGTGTTAGDLYSMDPVVLSLAQEKATLNSQVATLTTTNQGLTSQIAALTATNQTLTGQITSLQDQNALLTTENIALTQSTSQLQASLTTANQALTQAASNATSAANLEIAALEAGDGTTAWKVTGSMTIARTQHTLTVLADGRVLAVGATDGPGATLRTTEVFDADLQTWRPAALLNDSRVFQTASRLVDGRVLVVGGYQYDPATFAFTVLRSAELSDPAAGAWHQAAPTAIARYAHTATLLADGRVLVAGGTTSGFTTLNSAEIYNPAGDTWTPAASMNNGRTGHIATRLADGRVLVAGGAGATTAASAVEI